MPKVSIYLSDDLYERAKAGNLQLSALAQEAFERALDRDANAAWIERMRRRPPLVGPDFDISALMSEVREEFGA